MSRIALPDPQLRGHRLGAMRKGVSPTRDELTGSRSVVEEMSEERRRATYRPGTRQQVWLARRLAELPLLFCAEQMPVWK